MLVIRDGFILRFFTIFSKSAFAVFSLLFLLFLPSALHAELRKISVSTFAYSDKVSEYYAKQCESLMMEELSGLQTIEPYDSTLARAQAAKSSLTPEETLNLLMRSGAEIGITGEVEAGKDFLLLRFAGVRLNGERKGSIVADYASRIEIVPSGKPSDSLVCREHCVRFLEKLAKAEHFEAQVVDINAAKKKTHLGKNRNSDTAWFITTSPVISMFAPLAVPYGYLADQDYSGLGIWALNSLPWYVATFSAAQNELAHRKNGGSRPSKAARDFMYYNVFAGGVPLFVSFSTRVTFPHVRNYEGTDTFSGNDYTETFLALFGSGSGHFYKGYQFLGYCYYQIDTVFVIAALSCLHEDRVASWLPKGNRKRLAPVLAGLVAVRLLEAAHALYLPYNLKSGEEVKALPFLNIEMEKGAFGYSIPF